MHKNSDEKGRQVSKMFLPRMPFEKKRHLEECVYVFEVSSENNKTDITSKQAEVDWKARQSKNWNVILLYIVVPTKKARIIRISDPFLPWTSMFSR